MVDHTGNPPVQCRGLSSWPSGGGPRRGEDARATFVRPVAMSPEDRRTLRVGLVGFVVAVALILAAWRVVASDLPDFRAAAAPPSTTPTSEPPASRTPSETFAVPSPPPVTPTETQSPAPAVPEVVEPPLSTPAPTVAAAPQAAARAATPSPSQPSPSPAPAQVRGVDLSCSQNGKRIAATLSFVSSGPVAISVSAGGRTETSRGGGAVRMHVSGPGDPGAGCAAVVDGRPVGPVSGGRRR